MGNCLTSAADALDSITSTTSHDKKSSNQNCPLLNLPGEIKNRIFELVLPIGTTIVLRADPHHCGDRKFIRQCSPYLPSLYAVCRQLRTEFPIARYYAQNKFNITDGAFHKTMLNAFIAGRIPAINHIQNVVVKQWSGIRNEGFYIRFEASMGPDGVRLDEVVAERRIINDSVYNDLVCCCTLHKLFEDANKSQDEESKTLAAVLSAYGRTLTDFRVGVRSGALARSTDVCARCRNIKRFWC